MNQLPHMTGTGRTAKLLVDGKPFHARSGELHNSSASCPDYMEEHVWPALRGRNLNCIIAPIYWECTEPEEGHFDFSLTDSLIMQARREQVKLVLLWFGLWKNGASTYVPEWVKTDEQRFFRVKGAAGKPLQWFAGYTRLTVSPLCSEAVAADAKAFAALMEHLREMDGEENTVIAVQAENEIGVLGAARDYSPQADALFYADVPEETAAFAGKQGTWQEVFGENAAESFMAWHYAKAVEQIISAGKAKYPIPMFVNAWLEQEPWTPGSYPSGGPQFKMHRIWRAAAPSVDFIAPDIYIDRFRDVCKEYAADGNPLFIPETRRNDDTSAFYLYSVGAHNALCFAPFGIEDMKKGSSDITAEMLASLNIPDSAFEKSSTAADHLSAAYGLVSGLDPIIDLAHEEGRCHGFLDDGARWEHIHLKNLRLDISYGATAMAYREKTAALGGGLVIELGEYEFAVAAVNCKMSFTPREDRHELLDVLTVQEGRFCNGVWKRGRILNGDELSKTTFGESPRFLLVKLHPYIP